MESRGNTGRGGSMHREDPGLLAGVLASDGPRVYPENRCRFCEAEGKVEAEDCFHRHWASSQRPVGSR